MRLLSPIAFLLLLGGAAGEEDGNGRCEISDGEFAWSGPCIIERQGAHDVTLGWLPGHRFPFGWSGIFITSADGRTARLRVHISFGDDHELGTMRRSATEPDCWLAETLKICARERR